MQINNLINLTNLLQRGDDELKKDLFTLRNHELTSPLVREAIIAGKIIIVLLDIVLSLLIQIDLKKQSDFERYIS